jgi:uncharacterized protein YoxC
MTDPGTPPEPARTTLSVSNRTLAIVAGLAAAALIIATVTAAAVLIPTLRRVDRTLSLIEQAMPVITALGPEVDRIDRNVEAVAPEVLGIRDPLGRMEGRLGSLSAPIERMAVGLDGVEGSVDDLPELRRELVRMHATMREISRDFDATGTNIVAMLNRLDRLAQQFERVVALLTKTAEHVENLDRKTGPAPPD